MSSALIKEVPGEWSPSRSFYAEQEHVCHSVTIWITSALLHISNSRSVTPKERYTLTVTTSLRLEG